MAKKTIHFCPRCGGAIPSWDNPGAHPGALSRWDNMTEICSPCGVDEAMAQFMFRKNPQRAVHPVLGKKRWFAPPTAVQRG